MIYNTYKIILSCELTTLHTNIWYDILVQGRDIFSNIYNLFVSCSFIPSMGVTIQHD